MGPQELFRFTRVWVQAGGVAKKQSPVAARLAHDLAHPQLRENQLRLRKIDHNGNCRGQFVRNAIACCDS